MIDKGIYASFLQKKKSGLKSLAVLIDPDKTGNELPEKISHAQKAGADYFFVGSSMMLQGNFSKTVEIIKKNSTAPVVIFPGNRFQISADADALLLLSLISGRNPELLIGQHVSAAPELRKSKLEIIPTGYMLIDGGTLTSVNYISQSLPIPNDKPDIAVATAMAGEMLGMKLIYLEAGSGAKKTVSPSMVTAVRERVEIPLIVGGGIRDAEKASDISNAGADIVVVGNGFEKDPSLIFEIACAVHEAGKSSATEIHSA